MGYGFVNREIACVSLRSPRLLRAGLSCGNQNATLLYLSVITSKSGSPSLSQFTIPYLLDVFFLVIVIMKTTKIPQMIFFTIMIIFPCCCFYRCDSSPVPFCLLINCIRNFTNDLRSCASARLGCRSPRGEAPNILQLPSFVCLPH